MLKSIFKKRELDAFYFKNQSLKKKKNYLLLN